MPFPLDGKNRALYEMKRGLRLIFQVGGPAFLRSAALFPVVKCVEVYACQIDRLTKAQNGQISSPQNTWGGTLARSWQSHIPFGSLFSFQGAMKRPFTCSHWEVPNYRVFLKRFLYFAKDPFTHLDKGGRNAHPFSGFLQKIF